MFTEKEQSHKLETGETGGRRPGQRQDARVSIIDVINIADEGNNAPGSIDCVRQMPQYIPSDSFTSNGNTSSEYWRFQQVKITCTY